MSRTEKISPNTAKRLLSTSQENMVRPVTMAVANKYADIMQRGGWKLTGQGISIDKSGKLLDGFHRMTAIAMLDKPVELLVVRDVDVDAIYDIDSGKRRNLVQFLRHKGEKNAVCLSQAIRYLPQIRHKTVGLFNPQMSIKESLNELGKAGNKLRQCVSKTISIPRPWRSLSPEGFQAAMFYVMRQKYGDSVWEEWVEGISTGADLESTDPIIRLRERYAKQMKAYPAKGEPKKIRMACYIKAWNAWLAGEEMSYHQMRWRSAGPKKEEMPQPEFDVEI